jgi:hypothetical protein
MSRCEDIVENKEGMLLTNQKSVIVDITIRKTTLVRAAEHKEEYEILADELSEERAKNSRDSSMDDEDLQSRTSKETYRTQRTRTVDRDDKKLFLYHASAEEKSSAPSDADSDQNVEMEGLAQRAIGSENISHLLINRITEPPTANGRENCSFLVAQHSGTAEYVPLRGTPSDSNYRQGNAQKKRERQRAGQHKER